MNETHKHEWYVDGAHESNVDETNGWVDLGLICISDDDCEDTASVMVDIDPKLIRIDE